MYDSEYFQKLGSTLVSPQISKIFYGGNVEEGSNIITKTVVELLGSDRASIWTFNIKDDGIVCDSIYIKSTGKFHCGLELLRNEYESYFEFLDKGEIIIADDVESHPATSCFLESYLKPLGIKSIMDIPIWYNQKIIGVFCVEHCSDRKWLPEEIQFVQLLSSLYSFAHSTRENKILINNLQETEKFIDTAKFIDAVTLISKTDENGIITYINKRFTEVSEWSIKEAIGSNHNIISSGYHNKNFWKEMYRVTIKEKKIWNRVITNKSKNGEIFYVDAFVKANFNESGEVTGFISIMQDVSKIIECTNIINRKNTYLEHAAKILRHDMHSGINTYIQRGIKSLERRLSPELIKDHKLDIPLRLLKEGLLHTQKVYRGVYEFTNIVKNHTELNTEEVDIRKALKEYLHTTSYSSSVIIEDLGTAKINEPLFCTAIDNLIRNGLKYNDSDTKWVKIYRNGDIINIKDNGRGMTQEDFNYLSKPYIRKERQIEEGTGLGLNICSAILEEHGFRMTCRKSTQGGTIISVHIGETNNEDK